MLENSLHLIFPFCASLLFTFGALCVNKSAGQGVSAWVITLIANLWAGLLFSCFWGFGGVVPSWTLLWQPACIALLYIVGQVLILSALSFGAVSVAAPVASVKVVLVAVILILFTESSPSLATWLAAGLAVAGVVCINFTRVPDKQDRVPMTILLAFSAGLTFAVFDVAVQEWSPGWGTGRILPISYWLVSMFSLALLGFTRSPLRELQIAFTSRPVLLGGFFMAAQAVCIVYSLSSTGDAARVNVVYSLRGLWGVILTWGLARRLDMEESRTATHLMLARLGGATLLVVAVIMTIVLG